MADCLCCGTPIGKDWPVISTPRGDICMGCEGAEVAVYVMTIDGKSYTDRDVSSLMTAINVELETMDNSDQFTIGKRMMRAAHYYSLPEFEGF